MLIDIHLHSSRHSACSGADPAELVRAAAAKGLQGAVLTEHHYLWPKEELDALRKEAEVGRHFLLLAGQEVVSDIGHLLVFGAGRSIRSRRSLSELRKNFPEAALVWAHPFRGREPEPEELLNPALDAVEILNTNHSAKEHYRALELWHRCRFTAVAGSDAHEPRLAGVFPTYFDHPMKTARELAGEIRAGRCRPFLKEIPRAGGNTVVTAISLGAKGEDEYRERLILRKVTSKKKWTATASALEVVSGLLERGFEKGSYRVPRIIEVDEEERIVIEEGQRGKLLFDLLPTVSPRVGGRYFRMAGRWLGRLHRERLRAGEIARTRKKEEKKFESYRERFRRAGHPGRERFEKLLERTVAGEEELFAGGGESFVQVHGDYHPKNIIIGQDRMQDIATLFISVIDFDKSLLFDPAFDVGAFLAQFAYQFRHHPRVREYCREEDFLKAYRSKRGDPGEGFEERVRLFRVRANLSIANYLLKVGKGASPDLESLLTESESLFDNSGHTSPEK